MLSILLNAIKDDDDRAYEGGAVVSFRREQARGCSDEQNVKLIKGDGGKKLVENIAGGRCDMRWVSGATTLTTLFSFPETQTPLTNE